MSIATIDNIGKSDIKATLVSSSRSYAGKSGKTYLICGHGSSADVYPNTPSINYNFTPTYNLDKAVTYIGAGNYGYSYAAIIKLTSDYTLSVSVSSGSVLNKVYELS